MQPKLNMSYGNTLYRPDTLKYAVDFYMITINYLLENHPSIAGLVSTGSSGAILAGAVMCRSDLFRPVDHIHACKPNAGQGHSGPVSGAKYGLKGDLIFIDDFIAQGNSLNRCFEAMREVPTCNEGGVKLKFAVVNNGGTKVIFKNQNEFRIVWAGYKRSVKTVPRYDPMPVQTPEQTPLTPLDLSHNRSSTIPQQIRRDQIVHF